MKESTLASHVEGTTTIIFIVPEGTNVSAPVESEIKGTVREIQESGEHRNILVEPEPVAIKQPGMFFFFRHEPVSYVAKMDKYTQVLVKPGDKVKPGQYLAGDVVCELDSSLLVEQEKQQQILVTQAGADLEKARKNVEIQMNQNLSDEAKGKLALELAILDLKKFVKGERDQQANELRGEVLIAQEELTQADEAYQFAKRLAKKGYKNQVELETARIAVVKARNKLAVAKEKLTVLTDYTFERTLKELTEKVDEARRELKRVRLQGLAALAQFHAEFSSRILTSSVEVEKLNRLRRQIKACKLVAPQNGKVVYAKQSSRRSEPEVIEEGTTVRERQKIISLPDFSQMKVEVKIHESKINNVSEGLEAKILVDALPDRTFQGVVSFVPDVPVQGSFPNRDLMLFETMVQITDEKIGELKPGMNAKVEIIADERDDVLQAPIQSIVDVGGSYVAWVVPKGQKRAELRKDIKIGATNSEFVEIKSGLKEGDLVVMNVKKRYSSEISALRDEYETNRPKAKKKKRGGRKTAAKRSPGGKKRNGAKSSARKKRGGDPMQWFRGMDKNSDGAIDKSEAAGPMADNFDQMDANKDGKIDSGEFGKAMQARRKKAGGGR